jgi:hypothetical protein
MMLHSNIANGSPLPARVIYCYVNTRRWLSDLEFFQIEISFLQALLDDYFIRLSDDSDHCEKLTGLKAKLVKLEKSIGKYSLQLQDHIHLITQDVEQQSTEQQEILAARQVELDRRIPRLIGSYRDTKMELFKLVGAIIRANKFLAG